jgi:thiol-disulfide isomerase/thioredoxin
MEYINDLEKLNVSLKEHEMVLLYFSGKNCAVCHALKPKIEQMMQTSFPKIKLIEIKTDEAIEACAYFGIFSLPSLLLYVEEKEFLKKGRNISVELFKQEVERIYTLYYKDTM